jgi:uncharacterized protein YkwD
MPFWQFTSVDTHDHTLCPEVDRKTAHSFTKALRTIFAAAKPTFTSVPSILTGALVTAFVLTVPAAADNRFLKRSAAQACDSADLGGAGAMLLSNFRRSNGLSAVRLDPRLMQLAQQQAEAMAARASLSHGDFASRIRGAGIRGEAAENIAAGYTNLPDAFGSWVNSSSHRANMLIPSTTRMGIGAAAAPSDYKMYWSLIVANGGAETRQ